MASSEGLSSVDPWSFRQSFNVDSWLLPDPFSHDNDILAKALHRSISTADPPLSPSAFFDSAAAVSGFSPPQTLSNVSFGSDPEFACGGGPALIGAKRKRGGGAPGGKIKPTKRRSRVSSKKSQTTFITADAANFRQMVQQVTGAKFIGSTSNGVFSQIVKPEPHRLANRLSTTPSTSGIITMDRSSSALLPTLDTSSFLSNHHKDLSSVSAPMSSFHHSTATTTTRNGGAGSAVELDSYPSFPTLESWKVM